LTQRTLANVCGVKLASLRSGNRLSEAEWERIATKTSLIQQMPVWHADVSTQTAADIRAGVRRMRRRHGRAPLVVVDYLQLLSGGEKAERRQVKIGQDTRAFKRLARDEGTTVIGMAQLNRDAANHKPQISDLREAGDIEQDADVVILLHCPDENDGRMLASVAKHRSGPVGTVELVRQGWFARVESKAFTR
jgi:replicative DNA helicase